ncbi:NB-ARC domain-containing protein [Streptomyces sp. NPDC056231]|uniref:NB-ARC domain-containing protein n=1 Tax=Streptomyces sp. NPDC056231 TaxID=3345755 RepID=UPI003AB0014C
MSATGGSAAAGGNIEIHAEDGSIAAQRIGEVHQHRHVHPPVREPVPWPQMVGKIPPRAGAFQERAERSRLRDAATSGGTVVLCQVLTGMGGVGKTQLAADYAEQAWNGGSGVDLLVWVSATRRDAIVAAFAQAGAQVCGADLADPQQAAATFLAWLHAGRPKWLVVLDDVADPNDLTGLWPPAVAHGRTLVTTRRRDAALLRGGRRLVEVGVFTPDEAVAYLTDVLAASGRNESDTELAALGADLGCLPLALSQAAAYIADAGIRVSAYREQLARQVRRLEDLSPDALPDDQPDTMAAAWSLSVEYADQLRPAGLARPMLELTAFLASNGIPAAVLTSDPALAYLAAHAGTSVTADDAQGALRALHRLSLLTAPSADEADQAVRVHQIVQRATRDTLTPERYEQTAHAAGKALLAAWPNIERDTALAQALRTCTTALISCTEQAGCLYRPDVSAVLDRIGSSLGESGQVSAAIAHYQQFAAAANRHLGHDHRSTLGVRFQLAFWRGHAGDSAGAADAFAALLNDYVRVLGHDDPDTLATRHSLASQQGWAGDPAGAAETLATLLDNRLRVLGPDDPVTLATRHSLAFWRGEAGDPAGAAEAFAALVNDCLRVLGPDHRETLIARNNLANWQGYAGDPAGAAEAYAALLEHQVLVVGPDHPDTFVTRHNLAYWQGHAGDPAGAAEAFAALLEHQLRVLDPDDPHILNTRNNLAGWRERVTRGEP